MSAIEATMRFSKKDRETPFTIDEWKDAVENTEGIKLVGEYHESINPKTKEIIRIKARDGDSLVYLSEYDEWVPIFSFHEGRITFEFPGYDPEGHPIRNACRALASHMDAIILDFYDIEWDYE